MSLSRCCALNKLKTSAGRAHLPDKPPIPNLRLLRPGRRSQRKEWVKWRKRLYLLMTCQLLLMVVGGAALRSTSLMTGHADGSAIRDETRTIRRASTQKPD
ncbi:uncharacterized protein K444DRAFT_132520 [Hyaloscypha bicolor E]|uniref:Uncharacterized protein n=1 Tax=Hyaloscypha bicolor E TaxID=1095630 RepID=A0A2J6ST66_9HELO|nr:uncharacterized protein K444DRAFT_132520 [Hyaloscypha bicolor E]PMD53950.1 hypothetical protein K444DRAFT_132520 [Hyaloscypha bicolor E]